MKDRKAREAAGGGHDTDEKFNVPYGRPGLSGAPAASRDYGLAERYSRNPNPKLRCSFPWAEERLVELHLFMKDECLLQMTDFRNSED